MTSFAAKTARRGRTHPQSCFSYIGAQRHWSPIQIDVVIRHFLVPVSEAPMPLGPRRPPLALKLATPRLGRHGNTNQQEALNRDTMDRNQSCAVPQ